MTRDSILRLAVGVVGWTLLVAAPASVPAAPRDCSALPPSALKERPCNPQAECLAAIPKGATRPALDARRKECSRLPTAGTCYGPDRYDPQADCRQRRK